MVNKTMIWTWDGIWKRAVAKFSLTIVGFPSRPFSSNPPRHQSMLASQCKCSFIISFFGFKQLFFHLSILKFFCFVHAYEVNPLSKQNKACRNLVLFYIPISNQITFIVTSPQHKCLGEWNSYERAPDSAKKTTNNLHMDRQCKKNCTGAFTVLQTVQKKTTTTIYIWTDSAKKNCTGAFTVLQTVQNNLHMDSTYLQTVQKTMCKIHIHILSTHSVL